MNTSLLSIGKRNLHLHEKTLAAARAIRVELDDDGKSCEPVDVVKHLTSDYVLKKVGKA